MHLRAHKVALRTVESTPALGQNGVGESTPALGQNGVGESTTAL